VVSRASAMVYDRPEVIATIIRLWNSDHSSGDSK
jgi:flagellar biosynthesis/type III secretory pathway M-ring protein FliF/YscJ